MTSDGDVAFSEPVTQSDTCAGFDTTVPRNITGWHRVTPVYCCASGRGLFDAVMACDCPEALRSEFACLENEDTDQDGEFQCEVANNEVQCGDGYTTCQRVDYELKYTNQFCGPVTLLGWFRSIQECAEVIFL